MTIPTLEQIESELFKREFYLFLKSALNILEPQTKFDFNWHIQEICQILQLQAQRIAKQETKEKDLLINIPPRSLKSLTITVCWNAWIWTFAPHIKLLTGSYSQSLSIEHAVLTRRLIQSQWYQSRWSTIYKLTTDQNTKTFFENDKGGSRNTTSTGSGVTGKGADIIIVDDPHTTQDSESELALKTAWDWYSQTLFSRLNNQATGLRLVVMQRLNENDISGKILDKKLNYSHICLPATQTDSISPEHLKEKYTDGLLFGQRFSEKMLEEAKIILGSRAYNGQYEQRPAPAEGLVIKKEWLQKRFFTTDLPDDIIKNFFSDTAYGLENSDNSATICYSHYKNNVYIWAISKVNLGLPQFIIHFKEWVKQNGYTQKSKCYFEPKATGISVVQSLIDSEINAIKDIPPRDSKATRLSAILPSVEAGKVFFNASFDWNDFIKECLSFPTGKSDDQVDCFTSCVRLALETQKDYSWIASL